MGFFIKQANEQYRNLPQVDKTRLASIFQLFTVNTHDSQLCVKPEVIDHLRALIISGRIFIFIAYYFISISLV